MAVSYHFKDLRELGAYIEQQAQTLRDSSSQMRGKRRAEIAAIEAGAFEQCARIIAATTLES